MKTNRLDFPQTCPPYSNLVLAIPHAAGSASDVEWTSETCVAKFRDRWTDWDTDKLFLVKMKNVAVVSCAMSRIDVDVERLENEDDRLCNYRHISKTKRLPSHSQWNRRLAEWFRYREELMLAASNGERPLILDCHSFPSDLANDVDICIGFNTDDTKPSDTTINTVSKAFRAAGYSVAYNHPYSNTIAPFGYRGHSLMIEVSKKCYLDSDERHIGNGFDKLHQTLASVYRLLLRTSSIR